jgi:site-specific recombinase XerD
MIYRHGLRASELCDLQWSQVELTTGRLPVRRAKNGSPSVHPMQGDEIRALRRLQREQGASSHVFMSERDGPMTPKAFHALFGRIGARAKMQFPIHPHMLRHGCGYALANAGHDTTALQAWLGPETFSTRCVTPSWHRTGSKTFGAIRQPFLTCAPMGAVARGRRPKLRFQNISGLPQGLRGASGTC